MDEAATLVDNALQHNREEDLAVYELHGTLGQIKDEDLCQPSIPTLWGTDTHKIKAI